MTRCDIQQGELLVEWDTVNITTGLPLSLSKHRMGFALRQGSLHLRQRRREEEIPMPCLFPSH